MYSHGDASLQHSSHVNFSSCGKFRNPSSTKWESDATLAEDETIPFHSQMAYVVRVGTEYARNIYDQVSKHRVYSKSQARLHQKLSASHLDYMMKELQCNFSFWIAGKT